MNAMWRGMRGILAVVVAMGVAACDDDPVGAPTDVASVVVDPAEASVLAGDSVRLTAIAKTSDGRTLSGYTVTWYSEGTASAEVEPAGIHGWLKAESAGSVLVRATVSGKSGEAEVEVSNPMPAVTSLSPETVEAGSGAFVLTVVGTGFVEGSTVLWNDEERPTTRIGRTELRAALSAADVDAVGTADVRVTTPVPGGGTSGARTFTVSEPAPPPVGPVASVEINVTAVAVMEGESVQLSAIARDAAGQIVNGRFVGWFTDNAEVAPVGAGGLVMGVRTGTATITARVDGVNGSIPAQVSADYPYELVFSGWDGSDVQTMRFFRTDLGDPARAAFRMGPDVGTGGAVPSPDGSRVAFLRNEWPWRVVMLANVDGTGARELHWTQDAGCGRFTWSPDGEHVAFDCAIGDADRDIWVVDAQGQNLVNITDAHPGRQEWPSWSPELPGGSRIAYAQFVNGEPQIWTMKPDGSDRRQVTAGMDRQPTWSPDGTTIAFQRTGAAIFGDIWAVDANGGNERSLVGAFLAGPQEAPAWSPDGRLLAFSSTHEGYGSGGTLVRGIYTVWADGSRLARRTLPVLDAGLPAWRVR